MSYNQDAVTPGREAWVEIDIPEPVVTRPTWSVERVGSQLSPTRVSKADVPSAGIARMPNGSLTLAPKQPRDMTAEELRDTFIRITDVNCNAAVAGPPARSVALLLELDGFAILKSGSAAYVLNKLIDLGVYTAMSAELALGSQLPYAFSVTHPAGERWDLELVDDVAAFPKPPTPEQPVALNRVLSGKVTYPANTGFVLRIAIPGPPLSSSDCLINWYFGGPASVLPRDRHGGEFCISLYGNGSAYLWEREGRSNPASASDWTLVGQFTWSEPGRATNWVPHVITVVPNGQYGLDVTAASASGRQKQVDGSITPVFGSYRWQNEQDQQATVLDARSFPVAYTWKRTMTGAGPVRVDVRRDLVTQFALSRVVYSTTPGAARLVDGPALIPLAGMPEGQPLYLQVYGDTPAGTSLTAKIYDAQTGAEVPTTDMGYGRVKCDIPSGVRAIQPCIAMESQIPTATPTIRGIQVSVDGSWKWNGATPITHVPRGRVSITGPDLYPDHESASVHTEDLGYELGILRGRGRILSRICCSYPVTVAGQTSNRNIILFEGETCPGESTQRGTSQAVWPVPNWRADEIPFVGRWARLADQMSFAMFQFSQASRAWEPTLTPDPKDGTWPPWRVTDIIRFMFNHCGVPDIQLDIPDLPIRFWPAGDGYSALMTPGSSFIEWIRRLVRDYLGYYLAWDANATPYGKWRVLAPPQPDPVSGEYTPLMHFVYGPDPAQGSARLPHLPGGYPENTTWIRNGSYSDWLVPPEANYALVTATGQAAGGSLLTQSAVNPLSYDWDPANPSADPTHQDYLSGRFVPVTYHEPGLVSSFMDPAEQWRVMNFILYRLANQTFHGQLWCQFVAPLWFVKDPQLGHYRPPRVYDPVTIGGYQALIRSCNPEFEQCDQMWAHFQAMFITSGLYVG